MKLKLFEYEILDIFWTPLPNEDFNVKWQALAGPAKCMKQIITTKEMFEEETERFQKQQSSDLSLFDEKVEALNMTISQFSSQYDTEKTTEISIDIKKLWKLVTDTLAMGTLLNLRQGLFEVPEIDLSGIEQLRGSFAPYKVLWTTGADFFKWEEAWCGNPLPNIDVESIKSTIMEYKDSLTYCIDVFSELPKVQEVAQYFYNKILLFDPVLNVLGWLKNPAWIMYHWQELCKQTGLEIKYSTGINFDYCKQKGIMKFYSVVQHISEEATRNKDILEAQMAEEERLKREAEEERLARRNQRRGRKLIQYT